MHQERIEKLNLEVQERQKQDRVEFERRIEEVLQKVDDHGAIDKARAAAMDRAAALEKQVDMLQQSHEAELRIAKLEKQIAEEKSSKAMSHLEKMSALMEKQKDVLDAKAKEVTALRSQLSD